MAIVWATNVGQAKGKIGMNVYSVNAGDTVARQKAFMPRNPKTFAQMARRVRWANMVSFFRSFSGDLHPSFEGKAPRVSDFNEFLKQNINGVPIYLTSAEAAQGACVVAAYQITRGTLPAISVQMGTGDVPVSNIALGNLVIDEDTTVGMFSRAVVNNNPDFLNGDCISVFVCTQEQNSVTGIPYAKVLANQVTLNVLDEETLLMDIVPANGFTSVDSKLGASGVVVGGIAWIHSRRDSSETLVSSQQLFVSNALLVQYQTVAKRDEAILSYKGNLGKDFLTPTRIYDQSLLP